MFILHESCKVPAAVLCRQCGLTDSLCVSRGILWYLRGLISKLLEVGFDLALRALITLFSPLAALGAAFLAHI